MTTIQAAAIILAETGHYWAAVDRLGNITLGRYRDKATVYLQGDDADEWRKLLDAVEDNPDAFGLGYTSRIDVIIAPYDNVMVVPKAAPAELNGYPVVKAERHANCWTVMVNQDGQGFAVATWWPELGTSWMWGHYSKFRRDADRDWLEVSQRNAKR